MIINFFKFIIKLKASSICCMLNEINNLFQITTFSTKFLSANLFIKILKIPAKIEFFPT